MNSMLEILKNLYSFLVNFSLHPRTLIVLYAFLVNFTWIAGHSYIADTCRELYIEFKEKYPEYVRGFEWAFESKLTFTSGLAFGALSGMSIAIVTYIIIKKIEGAIEKLKNKRSYKSEDISELYRFASFWCFIILTNTNIFVFIIISLIANPYFLGSAIDCVYTFVIGMLLGIIVFIYFIRLERKKLRRSKFYNDKEAQLLIFKLEHEELRTVIHVLIIIGIGFITTIISGTLYYINLFPRDISLSLLFWKGIYVGAIFYIFLLSGYFGGVLYPYLCMLGDLYDSLGRYSRKI